MSLIARIHSYVLQRRLAKHLATADMATRKGQRDAERLCVQIDAIARREAMR